MLDKLLSNAITGLREGVEEGGEGSAERCEALLLVSMVSEVAQGLPHEVGDTGDANAPVVVVVVVVVGAATDDGRASFNGLKDENRLDPLLEPLGGGLQVRLIFSNWIELSKFEVVEV